MEIPQDEIPAIPVCREPDNLFIYVLYLHHRFRIPVHICFDPCISKRIADNLGLADPVIARIVHVAMDPESRLCLLDQIVQIRIEGPGNELPANWGGFDRADGA